MNFRDFAVSLIGHVIILGSLIFFSNINTKPKFQELNYYTVTAVSASSVSELLKKGETTVEPEPEVPQVKTPEKALPQKKPKKKSQEVKKSKTEDVASISKDKKTGTSQTGTGFDGIQTENVFKFPDYLMKVRDLVEQNWNPPSNTDNANKATVYFKIDRKGKILRILVKQASGNKSFDATAWNAIVKCDPFPPLPDAYTENTLGVFFDFLP